MSSNGPARAWEGPPPEWTPEEAAEIERLCARYPTRRSALLPVMWIAQDRWGWLPPPVLDLVARTLALAKSDVLAVASFYTMFKKEPTGRHLIQVCHTLSCKLMGAEGLVLALEKALGIKCGETTLDGRFTLMRVECLASCGSAPMCQVDEQFYEQVKPERVGELLAALRDRGPALQSEADRWTFEFGGTPT